MAAWSVPGSQRTSWPVIRRYRHSTSWIVKLVACPMCSSPVTLGGGIAIVNLGLGLRASARNKLADSQRAYQPASMALGSYADGMGVRSVMTEDLTTPARWKASSASAPAGVRLRVPRFYATKSAISRGPRIGAL